MVFLIKDGKTFLRISTVKDTSVGGYADFCKLIDAMRPQGWPFRSNPVSALKGPVYKHMLQRTGLDDRVMFVIVTDGKFSTRQAGELCDFADRVRDNFNWRLVLTSSIKNIPANLLLPANECRIHWCKLSDALDPASMKSCIQRARRSVTANQKKPAKKPAPESAVQESEGQLTPETQPPKTIELVVLPKAKAPVDSESKTPPASAEPNSIIQEDKTSRSDEQPQKLPARASIPAPEAWELKSKKEQKKMVDEPRLSIDESAEAKRELGPFPASPVLLWTIGGASFIAATVAFVAIAWAKANIFQKKLFAPLANQPKEKKPTVLVVRVDGVVHRIGDIRRIKNFHIGKDQNNTIRLTGNKVSSRHLHVFRRTENWFVRNLASQTVLVNGRELRKGRKCLLTFPAVIRIDDDSSFELFLQRSDKRILPQKEGGHKNGK